MKRSDSGSILALVIKVLAGIFLLGVSVAFALHLVRTRPQAQKIERPAAVPSVSVHEVTPGPFRVTLSGMGTVIAARQVTVQPEISGIVTEVHPSALAGGLLSEGDVLFSIDPREYQLALEQQQSLVDKAESEILIEEGRQRVAREEWEHYRGEGNDTVAAGDLALRKPQLQAAQANLASAKSGLERSRLNLSKTSVAVPFNAVVIDESLEIGQFLSPQSRVATLVGTDLFRVQVSLPLERLSWLPLDGLAEGAGPKASVSFRGYGGGAIEIEGRLSGLLRDVDPAGRMARLLVDIEDPLRLGDTADLPLLLGTYVNVVIDGKELKDVVSLPRRALRGGDRLWLLDADSRLETRSVDILFADADSVVVDGALEAGALVIMSRIATPVDGMALKRLPSPPESGPGSIPDGDR